MEGKEMLGAYVDTTLKMKVDKAAKELGISTSDFVRKTITFTIATLEEEYQKGTAANMISSDSDAKEKLKEEIKRDILKEIKGV